ncbi:MAG: phage GP46 family protein [Spirochaetota bacterium]
MAGVTRYDGDIALISSNDGGDILFESGQARMEQGLFSAVYMSLFTESGWWGNRVLAEEERIGCRIEELRSRTLTNSTRLDFIAEARNALAWMVDQGIAGRVDVDAAIVAPGMIGVIVTIHQPGSETPQSVRFGLSWDATLDTEPYRRDPIVVDTRVLHPMSTHAGETMETHTGRVMHYAQIAKEAK